MRAPKRLSGRRHHAKAPVPMKLRPMSGMRIAVATFSCSWSERSTSATVSAAKITPRANSARSARRRPSMGLRKEGRQGGAGEVALGDEPAGAAAGDERPEVGGVAARDEDDSGRPVLGGQPL